MGSLADDVTGSFNLTDNVITESSTTLTIEQIFRKLQKRIDTMYSLVFCSSSFAWNSWKLNPLRHPNLFYELDVASMKHKDWRQVTFSWRGNKKPYRKNFLKQSKTYRIIVTTISIPLKGKWNIMTFKSCIFFSRFDFSLASVAQWLSITLWTTRSQFNSYSGHMPG